MELAILVALIVAGGVGFLLGRLTHADNRIAGLIVMMLVPIGLFAATLVAGWPRDAEAWGLMIIVLGLPALTWWVAVVIGFAVGSSRRQPRA